MVLKIFVSPFKTGTTSIGRALQLLNYRVIIYSPTIFSESEYQLIFLANDLVKQYKTFRHIPETIKSELVPMLSDLISSKMVDYDCATDYPMGHECIHPYIRKLIFPDAKFIFLDRDEESFVKSVKHHETITLDPPPHIKLFWEYRTLSSTYTWNNYQAWRANYEDLQSVFPKDVLFMDINQGWDPLLDFLNIGKKEDLPNFPWANKTTFT